MQITRHETEQAYLHHQLGCLLRLHEGPLEWDYTHLPDDGWYHQQRLTVEGEGLMRAYQLLYPRDERHLTPTIFDMVGLRGLAALICDCSDFRTRTLKLHLRRWRREDILLAEEWIQDLGFDVRASGSFQGLTMDAETERRLLRKTGRYIHSSMRRMLIRKRRF